MHPLEDDHLCNSCSSLLVENALSLTSSVMELWSYGKCVLRLGILQPIWLKQI